MNRTDAKKRASEIKARLANSSISDDNKKLARSMYDKTFSDPNYDISQGLHIFDRKGWDKWSIGAFVLFMGAGFVCLVTAMSAAGVGTNHPWLEYDQYKHTQTVTIDIVSTDKVDIYFEHLNGTYKETTWSLFGILVFLSFSCVFMVVSPMVNSEFVSDEDLSTFKSMSIATTALAVVGLVLIIQPLHLAMESTDDQTAGAHLTEWAMLNTNVNNDGLYTPQQITVLHRDGWPVRVITSGLCCILAAPFIATFFRGFYMLRLRTSSISGIIGNHVDATNYAKQLRAGFTASRVELNKDGDTNDKYAQRWVDEIIPPPDNSSSA